MLDCVKAERNKEKVHGLHSMPIKKERGRRKEATLMS